MDSSGPPGAPECSPRGDGVLLPYGQASDGRLVRASEVPAGLGCGCTCPACGAPLVARRGGVRIAHFAHAVDRACASAHETMLHRLAKQLIADGTALTLPEVAVEYDGRRRLVRPAVTIRPEGAALEPGLDGLRPDILVTVAGRPLLVEVAVTHFCGPEKWTSSRGGVWPSSRSTSRRLPVTPRRKRSNTPSCARRRGDGSGTALRRQPRP